VKALATLWLWLCVALTLPVAYVLALLLLACTFWFDPHRRLLQRFVGVWCHQYLRCWPGWRVRIEGRELLPRGPCVIIANHQSMTDILALMGLPVPFKFVSKRSLFSTPFIGLMMRLMKYVAIERGRFPSMQEMMVRCDGLLEAGQAVLIFPEGTYATGDTRLPFKRGAFRLAQKRGVPIVPVVVTGTRELVFEDGFAFAARANVVVRVMPPMSPPPMTDDGDAWVLEAQALYASWLGSPGPTSNRAPPF